MMIVKSSMIKKYPERTSQEATPAGGNALGTVMNIKFGRDQPKFIPSDIIEILAY